MPGVKHDHGRRKSAMRPIDAGSAPGHRGGMSADAVPAVHHEPDGTVLLVYPGGRRLRVLPDGRVEGLRSMERLLLAALRLVGHLRGRRRIPDA